MGMVLDTFNNPPVVDQFALSYTGPYTGGFTGGPPCNPQVDDIAGNNAYFNALCVGGVQVGPNASQQIFSATGVVSNPTTNSISPAFVDMPDMTITFTLGVKTNVLAQFTGVFSTSLANTVVSLVFNLDGALEPIGATVFNSAVAAGADTFTMFAMYPNILPGTHTIKMQWAVNQGVVTGSGTTRNEIVTLFPNP